MIEFELPEVLTEDFLELVPQQRMMINKMLADGKIENFNDHEDENSDLSSEEESDSSDSASDNECLVPVPDMAQE